MDKDGGPRMINRRMVPPSEGRGREFESRRARHKINGLRHRRIPRYVNSMNRGYPSKMAGYAILGAPTAPLF